MIPGGQVSRLQPKYPAIRRLGLGEHDPARQRRYILYAYGMGFLIGAFDRPRGPRAAAIMRALASPAIGEGPLSVITILMVADNVVADVDDKQKSRVSTTTVIDLAFAGGPASRDRDRQYSAAAKSRRRWRSARKSLAGIVPAVPPEVRERYLKLNFGISSEIFGTVLSASSLVRI